MASITNLDTATGGFSSDRYAISLASWNRPANTTAYSALDVISDSTSTAKVIEFPGVGMSGAILRATMTIAETDTITPRLWLFDSEPTNFADGDALALVAADLPKIVGRFDFVDADKLLVGTLLNVYFSSGDTTAANEVALKTPYSSADGKLYGILQSVPGYTPVSEAKFGIRLQLERGGR